MKASTTAQKSADPYDLNRFLSAQLPLYGEVLRELAAGRKRSHWMWFIFPQLAGLGRSSTAEFYAITALAEARAYLAHPILGARLLECTRLVNGHGELSALQLFGSPDDLKFHSSMTLFELAAGPHGEFSNAIEQFYAGERDSATLQLLAASAAGGPGSGR